MSTNPGNRLLVALDVDSADRALAIAEQVRGLAGGLKVGSRLFTMAGPDLVRRLVDSGARVFLDLKFHDIPNTVAQAVDAAVRTGAWMINVHASGGAGDDAGGCPRSRRRRGGNGCSAAAGHRRHRADEHGRATLQQTGVARPLLDHVLALARMAQSAGLHGVVASPQETSAIRQACGPDFAIVTPGIRGASAGQEKNDQSRTLGPAEAVKAGATYIVVGRPIIAAPDPRGAAQAIVEELDSI